MKENRNLNRSLSSGTRSVPKDPVPEDDFDLSEDDIPEDDFDLSEDDIPESDFDPAEDDIPESDFDPARDDIPEKSGKAPVSLKTRTVLLFLGIAAAVIGAVYLAGCLYFAGHFMLHTTLNGVDVSFCRPEEAKARVEAAAADYTLTVRGRDDVSDVVQGSEISYSVTCSEDLSALIQETSCLQWPLCLWTSAAHSVSCSGLYDEAQLESKLTELAFFQSENIRQPSDAVCSYADGSYQVVAGDPGTVPDESGILQSVQAALSADLSEVTLGDDCYREAELTADDPGLQETASLLNQILDMTVTISFDEKEEILTREQLASFIAAPAATESADSPDTGAEGADSSNGTTDTAGDASSGSADTAGDASADASDTSQTALTKEEQLQAEMEKRLSMIDFQEAAITEYVASLADTYDTCGKDREFTTHDGDTITVSGGDYGWQMDQEGTVTALKAFLTAAESGSFDPVWTQEAASHGDLDIGTTYAEADLDQQKVYLYVDGECILETDCVSGKAIDSDRITPTGTYRINYRKSPAVLKGADYESPVTYWMPFNRGVGFHDATWRSKFGGEIYLTAGSHGCINLPYDAAGTLYENVYSGMPVVVYGGMSAEEAQEYTGKKPDPPVSVRESETDIGGGADASSDTGAAGNADGSASDDTADPAAAQITSEAQTAVLQQAIQNYMDQGMSAEAAQAQVQADLAAQYAAQQAAAAAAAAGQ